MGRDEIRQFVTALASRGRLSTRSQAQASFPTRLLQDGYDIRTVQELLEHRDVAMTMIYIHLLNKSGLGVRRGIGYDVGTCT